MTCSAHCDVDILTLIQMSELSKLISEMKTVLYGNEQSEPLSEACSQLTLEFFKEDILRLLIVCLPKLNTGVSLDQFLYHVVHASLFLCPETLNLT